MIGLILQVGAGAVAGYIAGRLGCTHLLSAVPVVCPVLTPFAVTGVVVGTLTERCHAKDLEADDVADEPLPTATAVLGGAVVAIGYGLVGRFIQRSPVLSVAVYAGAALVVSLLGRCWPAAPLLAATSCLLPKTPGAILGIILGLQVVKRVKVPLPVGQPRAEVIPAVLAAGVLPGFNPGVFLAHLTERRFPYLSKLEPVWEMGALFSFLLFGKADGKTLLGNMPLVATPAVTFALLAGLGLSFLPWPSLPWRLPSAARLGLSLAVTLLLAPDALLWAALTATLGIIYPPSPHSLGNL